MNLLLPTYRFHLFSFKKKTALILSIILLLTYEVWLEKTAYDKHGQQDWGKDLQAINLATAKLIQVLFHRISLTLSRRRSISYRNQPIDLQSKSMDWFLYDFGLRQKRVNSTWSTNLKLFTASHKIGGNLNYF